MWNVVTDSRNRSTARLFNASSEVDSIVGLPSQSVSESGFSGHIHLLACSIVWIFHWLCTNVLVSKLLYSWTQTATEGTTSVLGQQLDFTCWMLLNWDYEVTHILASAQCICEWREANYTAPNINVCIVENVYDKSLSLRACADGLAFFQTTPHAFWKLCFSCSGAEYLWLDHSIKAVKTSK